ncbi:GNAT family N-acetyltransferase [Dyadobacter sp. CY356]|uniref:GNAT family N-acetyltransferase n=1 Tax=Dyadobacter sp. CY356 TaxID=2906442 RepID=UPI001F362490|nr:GNAT family N-acetyltransferase [Dyadobacter sp. CY356]MCF0057594.1 GNAT family N-acetyltransferase [Dyadobacter sp. CY356]
MIRAATPADATAVAPLMILAMGHIAGIFANSENYEDAIPFFEMFFKMENNQYSYVNTLVYENEDGIIGSVTGYDGEFLRELRQPILDELRKQDPDFIPNDETEAGEYYLDCVNVKENQQGKGIGKKLINAFCDLGFGLGYKRIGLIVDMDNPDARKLYTNLGFYEVGTRYFMGHQYFHMVKDYDKIVVNDSAK